MTKVLAGDMAHQPRAIIEAMHALLALGFVSLMTPAYVALLVAAASLATLAMFDRR